MTRIMSRMVPIDIAMFPWLGCRRRTADVSTRELFFGTLFAEGGGDFSFLYASHRIAALTKILFFGTITHHARMRNLNLLPGVMRDCGFICHARRSIWGRFLSVVRDTVL